MIVFMALTRDINPPSNVELLDPKTLHLSGEFAEQNLGTTVAPDGGVTVRVIATQFMFVPHCIAVPRGRRVTLRFATPDVVHGLLITGTNVNTMVVPGFVAQVYTEFTQAADLLMPCHEYCGLGHSEAALPCAFLGRVRSISDRRLPWNLADVGSQPTGRQRRHAGTVFHFSDGAWRLDGLRHDHLLHHGLRLFRRRDCARPSSPGESLGVDRLLDLLHRRVDGARSNPHGSGLGPLYVLSPAHRQPLVLYRARAGGGRFVGMVRSHARRDARVEARKSRPACAAGHVRDGGKRAVVALDHGRCGGRTAVSSHPGGVGVRADHRCRPRTDAVLVDAACHRLFLAHPGLHRLLHDRAPRGGRAPLQRYDGPPRLHSVFALQPARRNASPVDGPRAWQWLEVHPGPAHGLCLRAYAADDLHHHCVVGNRRVIALRPLWLLMDRGAAVGPADGACDRPFLRDARFWRVWRAHQHGLRHERDGAQHLVDNRALSSDLRRLRRHHVFRDRLRNLAAPDRARPRVDRAAAAAAVAMVYRHDGDDAAVALVGLAGSMAARRQFQLC